jgi:aspartate racemase
MGMVTLDPARQEDFMATLYKIKAGDRGAAVRREMAGYAADLIGGGAEAIIAGCTEVPLVLGAGDLRVEFIDPGELLAKRCVAVCLGLEPVPVLPG